jgi:hypothetical protein
VLDELFEEEFDDFGLMEVEVLTLLVLVDAEGLTLLDLMEDEGLTPLDWVVVLEVDADLVEDELLDAEEELVEL